MIDSTTHCTTEPQAGPPIPSGADRHAPVIHRRYCRAETLDADSLQPDDRWLSRGELAELATWRDERRRRAWLLGRRIAKQLIGPILANGTPPARIEILSRDAAGRVNRPRIACDGEALPWSLSISHSERGALVALSTDGAVSLGVDVADTGRFSDTFVDLWFTPAERDWFRDTHSSSIACFIWAAKEALYKACNGGEGFAPRDVEVLPSGQCSYRQAPLADCQLQSWTVDAHLAVLARVTTERTTNRSD